MTSIIPNKTHNTGKVLLEAGSDSWYTYFQHMRTYQLSLVLSGKSSDAEQKKILDKVERNIESAGGKTLKNDKVGKKNLAYPIKKEKTGVYYFLDIEVPEEEMQALNRAIEVDDNILRHLLITA